MFFPSTNLWRVETKKHFRTFIKSSRRYTRQFGNDSNGLDACFGVTALNSTKFELTWIEPRNQEAVMACTLFIHQKPFVKKIRRRNFQWLQVRIHAYMLIHCVVGTCCGCFNYRQGSVFAVGIGFALGLVIVFLFVYLSFDPMSMSQYIVRDSTYSFSRDISFSYYRGSRK